MCWFSQSDDGGNYVPQTPETDDVLNRAVHAMREYQRDTVPLNGGFYATMPAKYTLRRLPGPLDCFVQRNETTGSERLMVASAPWYFQSDDGMAMVRCQAPEAAALEAAARVVLSVPPGVAVPLGGTGSLYDIDPDATYQLLRSDAGVFLQMRRNAASSMRVVLRIDLRNLQAAPGLPHTAAALRHLQEAA